MAPVTIPRTVWIDDDGTGTTGTVLNNAVKTELYNQIDTALAGVDAATQPPWINVTYSGAYFGGTGSMTWTVDAGDQIRFAYQLNGKTMTVSFYFEPTTLGGTAAFEVRITIPGGYTAKGWCTGYAWNTTGGVGIACTIRAAAGQTYLSILRSDSAAFVLGTNNVHFSGTFQFEIN
jgi:hypothetical protein